MSAPLGILDWGIGGLDLYRKLRAAGGTSDVVYWSDSGAPPYGTIEADALARRVAAVIVRLRELGCDRVVIACNAASTVLADPQGRAVIESAGVEVLGVIEPALAAIQARALPEVAVIGGRRTIESGAYARPLSASGCRVVQRIAQPLSALVERGLTEGPELEACLAEILDPIADAEHLVIACTHYVAAQPAIERRLPRLRTIIDPAAETLRAVEHRFGTTSGRSDARFLTTGDPEATRTAARLAFGLSLPMVERAEIKSA